MLVLLWQQHMEKLYLHGLLQLLECYFLKVFENHMVLVKMLLQYMEKEFVNLLYMDSEN